MVKTGFYSHFACLMHEMGKGHPECPERLHAISDRLLMTGLDVGLEMIEAPQASISDLDLAHDKMHVAALRGLSDQLRDDALAGGPNYAQLDPDTSMNPHTWDAILRASGAALAATDAVMAGELTNAFCAVRPPGHHACFNQAMGFCFVNNVAVAVKHALDRHGLERVAVIDFDVHHGNGTQNILSSDPRVLMASIYQHPYYPEGGAGEMTQRMVNVPVPAYTKGARIRELIKEHWLPALHEHQPQMIFISAGFDGHRDDEMGQLGLVESDYAWITQEIKAIAKLYAKDRIVSCLEGGYDLPSLAKSVEAHVRVLADLN
jgi:acetoin utilization deacetylase AcuC-like enzyme